MENSSLKKDIESMQKTLSGLGYTEGDQDQRTRDNTLANSANHAECGREIAELVSPFTLDNLETHNERKR